MTIRSVNNSTNIAASEQPSQQQPVSKDIQQNNIDNLASANTSAKPASERLSEQFAQSRTSFDSQQVQQQLSDSFFPLPFPLPLPRIPSPAGMIDFIKLTTVISTAIIDGLKNFGLEGISFAKSVAEAMVNGIRSVKEGVEGLSDLAKGNLGSLKSSVNGFSSDTMRNVTSMVTAANRLAASSDPAAQKLGAAALRYSETATTSVAGMKSLMTEYKAAADASTLKMLAGVETFTNGLLATAAGRSDGAAKMQEGQNQMLKALADLGAASEAFNAESNQNLQQLAAAKAELDQLSSSVAGLGSSDRNSAETVMRATKNINNSTGKLDRNVDSSTASMSSASEDLSQSLVLSIQGTWGKIGEAAQSLSSAVTGVNGTTKGFVNNTKEFRQVAEAARRGDKQAEAQLQAKWGFTKETLPPAGTLFVDPSFNVKDLKNGQVTGSQFPAGKLNNETSVEQRLFGNGRTVTLTNADGSTREVKSMSEYQEVIAAQRANKLGLPNDAGQPVSVHMSFEGGGGQGKRFIPALSEMFNNGVVPGSASGTSVGAIAAAIVAAGADPKKFEEVVKDERIGKFLDLGLGGRGGVFKGEEAYKFFDEMLRELTGIKDRPVTFADLKMPLNIVAAKYSDSNPPADQRDMSKWENRTFVFSQETTPNTPVALAMRASMAIPGVFDPVEMVDPTTGRTIQLTDGGTLNNLPLGYNKDGLPTVALNLNEPNINHPKYIGNNLPTLPAPKGQLFASNTLLNTLYGGIFVAAGGGLGKDFQERTNPTAGNFILSLPIWDLQNPKFADDALDFKYDPVLDGKLDQQTREVTTNFFRSFLQDLQKPGASGTNIKPLPSDKSFSREIELDGRRWTASYDGSGNTVTFTNQDGQSRSLFIGQRKLENWLIDDASFGDLNGRLRLALDGTSA